MRARWSGGGGFEGADEEVAGADFCYGGVGFREEEALREGGGGDGFRADFAETDELAWVEIAGEGGGGEGGFGGLGGGEGEDLLHGSAEGFASRRARVVLGT